MHKNILVVDDSLESLKSLTKLLELYHNNVTSTSSGKEALELLVDQNYDLVLIDIHAPEVDGMELLERVKHTINSDIPIILMSRHITVERTLKSIRLGAVDLVKKPIDDYQLIKTVSRHLEKKKANVYQHQISPYLVSSNYSYEFIAQDFASTNIGDFLTNNIRNIKDITPSAINELSLCFEELISNAFIHGTFGLSCSYKELNGDQYNRFITQLLKNNSVAEKKVFVNIMYRQTTGVLSVTVTDQGNGFDFESIKIDETNRFRGIGLISVLCDKVYYANGGRTVRIEKKIKKKSKPKVAASQS